jgi:hypothetical protein
VVCSTLKDLSSCFCDRNLTQPVLKCVRYLNERMRNVGEIGHCPVKRAIPHEDLFLQIPDRDEEPWPRERTLLMKDGKRLTFRAGQPVVGRRKLFQMTSQRGANKRQRGRIGCQKMLNLGATPAWLPLPAPSYKVLAASAHDSSYGRRGKSIPRGDRKTRGLLGPQTAI